MFNSRYIDGLHRWYVVEDKQTGVVYDMEAAGAGYSYDYTVYDHRDGVVDTCQADDLEEFQFAILSKYRILIAGDVV